MLIDRRATLLGGLALPVASQAARPRKDGARPGPYMLGADVSWIPEDEAAGAVYYDRQGRARDPLLILRDAGFNWVRLRLFVDPARGYSRAAPDKAWCGLDQTIAMGRRVKAAGMGLAVTLHYSDTWADPEHQGVPAAWARLSPAAMARAVEAHTRTSLTAMRRGGARVDMAIVGNETTFGMLWPSGQVALSTPTGNPQTDAHHRAVAGIGGWDGFAAHLRAGIAGARAADPAVLIQLHNHLGRHWPIVREWTDALLARGVAFDVLGLSCYQQAEQGDWARTFTEFTRRYPSIGLIATEYSSRKRYLNDLVHDLPGQRGWGSFIWEPTRHQEAVFDHDGRNAGGGAKPDLLRDGINTAEAPGAGSPPAPPGTPRPMGIGGTYRANALLDVYTQMAADYGLKR